PAPSPPPAPALAEQPAAPAVTAGHAGIRGGVIAGPAVTSQEPANTASGVCFRSGYAVANHAAHVAWRLEQAIDVAVDELAKWAVDPAFTECVHGLVEALLAGGAERGALRRPSAHQPATGQPTRQPATLGV